MCKWLGGVAVGCLVLVGACGGAAMPAGEVASAQAAIRAADEVGAESTPRAALHLKYARDQYAEAQRLMEEDREERASALLLRAEADAEVALAIAREEAAKQRAEAAQQRVQSLQQPASR